MAVTWSDLITSAFIDLAYIRPGATITTTMRDAAFVILQQFFDSLSAEEAMNYVVYHQGFTLTAGTSTYVVAASGGTLTSTARPIRITGWQSVDGNYRNGGLIEGWDKFHAEVKDGLSATSKLAQRVAADQAYPGINIVVYPTPATAPGTLYLDYYAPLTQPATVSDTVTLPDGWQEMLHFNLAVLLSPQYGRGGDQLTLVASNAANAKQKIAQKNASIIGLQPQAA